MTIRESLESFKPYNEQEEKDAELFKKSINDFNDILTRENEYCHVCSSAFITNKEDENSGVVWLTYEELIKSQQNHI